MRVKEYPVLVQAVENGVTLGWNRAHKHDSEPNDETVMAAVREAVLNEICEAFDFDNHSAES